MSLISVTDAAVGKVLSLAEGEGAQGLMLRIGVRPGGCSGFSYEMFFDSDRSDSDVVYSFGDLVVVVDDVSAGLLSGAVLDYKDGLAGTGFSITNPSASRTCGCGQSFS